MLGNIELLRGVNSDLVARADEHDVHVSLAHITAPEAWREVHTEEILTHLLILGDQTSATSFDAVEQSLAEAVITLRGLASYTDVLFIFVLHFSHHAIYRICPIEQQVHIWFQTFLAQVALGDARLINYVNFYASLTQHFVTFLSYKVRWFACSQEHSINFHFQNFLRFSITAV